MRVIIMGCGRRGAELATLLDADGHDVVILDIEERAFRFLPDGFGGSRIVGNGIDQDVLRRAGAERADAFVSTTRGDNRNVMAAQIAKYMFGVPRVLSLIHDPIREETYRALGLRTVSPTRVVARLLKEKLEAEDEQQAVGSAPGQGSAQ
jgi:trk system potassium uptake protein TrkA